MRNKTPLYGSVSYPKANHIPLNTGLRRPTKSPSRNIGKYSGLIIFTAVALTLGTAILPSSDKPGESLGVTDTSAAEEITPKIEEIDTTLMSQQIDAIIAEHPNLDISVAIYDIKADKQHTYGVDAAYVAASVSKLITATYLLHTVEEDKTALTEVLNGVPLDAHLQRLIVNSDNTSWRALNDKLIRANLMNYASDVGLQHYSSVDNTVRTKDVALLLKKIHSGELLNTENTRLLLSHMEKANRNQYISQGLPAGTKFYHKAGWLDDRIHDVGIVEHADRPYSIAIFSKSRDPSYPPAAIDIFSKIAGATANTYIAKQPAPEVL